MKRKKKWTCFTFVGFLLSTPYNLYFTTHNRYSVENGLNSLYYWENIVIQDQHRTLITLKSNVKFQIVSWIDIWLVYGVFSLVQLTCYWLIASTTQRNCHIISHQCCRRQWPRLNRPPKQKGRQKARSKSLRNISINVPQPIQAMIVGNMTFNGKKLSISPVKLSTLSHFPLLHLPSPTSFTLLASTAALCSLSSDFSKTWQGMICEEIKQINHERILQPVEVPPWLQSQPRHA